MNSLDVNKDPEKQSEELDLQNTVLENAEKAVDEQPVNKLEEAAPEIENISPEAKSVSVKPNYASMPKEELHKELEMLLDKDVNKIKNDVEEIKQAYYKIIKSETEAQKQAFLDEGGDEKDFLPKKDELEELMKNLFAQYKSKRAEFNAKIEKEKEDNLVQKQHILQQMKALVETNEDVSSNINEFKNLQQKWKSIGEVPPAAITELRKQYNNYQDSFWDLIKINNELREYDFRKNYEAKTLLCEAAEKLLEEADVVIAFRKLQKLHEDWHELGPVARDQREAIWTRFKEATTAINKRHQSFFDELRKNESENLAQKTALCEKIEAFDYSGLNTFKDWDEATKSILEWQNEWKSIGFAPKKINQKIFERYRTACDNFFTAKGEFYKETKKELVENLEKKRALIELAEELKDNTDWKATADKFVKIQKEWKTIGPVQKKYSDELWKKFIAACDYFFEQRNKNFQGQKDIELENLTKKKALIERINAFEKTADDAESLKALRELTKEWNEIGHVPFKEKDKIYKAYREAIDKQFDALDIDAANRRLDVFRENLKDMTTKGESKLYRERDKLMRVYENLKNEISTYENNIGFFTSSSKKGGGMIKEMERKIESLRDELGLVEQKVNLIDQELRSN